MPKKSDYSIRASETIDYKQDMIDFGIKVRMYREGQGLSLDVFANMIDSDKSAISRIENAERTPRYDTVLRIADALGISLSELSPDRLLDQNYYFALPQIHAKLQKLPDESRIETIQYITAMLDGLLLREKKRSYDK